MTGRAPRRKDEMTGKITDWRPMWNNPAYAPQGAVSERMLDGLSHRECGNPRLDRHRLEQVRYMEELGEDPDYLLGLIGPDGLKRLYANGSLTLEEFERRLSAVLGTTPRQEG